MKRAKRTRIWRSNPTDRQGPSLCTAGIILLFYAIGADGHTTKVLAELNEFGRHIPPVGLVK